MKVCTEDSDLTLPSSLALPLLQHLLDISSLVSPSSPPCLFLILSLQLRMHPTMVAYAWIFKISDKATSFPRSQLSWWALSLSLYLALVHSAPDPEEVFRGPKGQWKAELMSTGLTCAAAELELWWEECLRNRNYHLNLLEISFVKNLQGHIDATESLWCHIMIWLINVKSYELHWYIKFLKYYIIYRIFNDYLF